MHISTTFRHMDSSPAVRSYFEERLAKIKRYFQRDPISAHGVFAVEHDDSVMEVQVTLPSGAVVTAKEDADTMYAAIDLAMARVERQVRKWVEKHRDHKPHGEVEPPPALTPPLAARTRARAKGAPGASPKKSVAPVIKDAGYKVKPLSVDAAVVQLKVTKREFVVFADVDTRGVKVVYRRPDGNFGLIETGARLSA